MTDAVVFRPVSGVMATVQRDGLLLPNTPVFALDLRGHPEIADLARVVLQEQGGRTAIEWKRDGDVVELHCEILSPVHTAMVVLIPLTAREALEAAVFRGVVALGPDPLPYVAPGKLGAVLCIQFDPSELRALLEAEQ